MIHDLLLKMSFTQLLHIADQQATDLSILLELDNNEDRIYPFLKTIQDPLLFLSAFTEQYSPFIPYPYVLKEFYMLLKIYNISSILSIHSKHCFFEYLLKLKYNLTITCTNTCIKYLPNETCIPSNQIDPIMAIQQYSFHSLLFTTDGYKDNKIINAFQFALWTNTKYILYICKSIDFLDEKREYFHFLNENMILKEHISINVFEKNHSYCFLFQNKHYLDIFFFPRKKKNSYDFPISIVTYRKLKLFIHHFIGYEITYIQKEIYTYFKLSLSVEEIHYFLYN